MDDAPAAATPADLERRAVWIVVAAGLLLVLRSSLAGSFFLSVSRQGFHRQLWLYIFSVVPMGASALLAGLIVLPDLVVHPARIATRWNPVRLYGWAILLLATGVVVTAIAGVIAAIDGLRHSPFGG